jgi:hypothetical protein
MQGAPAPAPPAAVGVVGRAGAIGPEQPLWSGRPSLKALLGSILVALVAVGLLLAVALLGRGPALAFLGGLGPEIVRFLRHNADVIDWVIIGVVAVLVGSRLGRLGWRLAELKSRHYRITNQRITVESGVLAKRIDEIDMRSIEDLQLVQSLTERVLGIGDITVVSSDRTTPRLTLIGLPDPRALRELIRGAAYQATGGQLFTRQT